MKARLTCILLILGHCAVTFSQTPSLTDVKAVNINCKATACFFAASPKLEKTSGFGGWSDSDNMFIPINPNISFKAGKVSIEINTREKTLFAGKHAGLFLYVSNGSSDTVYFDAQDSRLDMKLQARDKNGEWKDIQYIPSSWCGNSYHMVYLPPLHYWKFTIPQYEGEMKTRLRAVLVFRKEIEGASIMLHSNEYDGSVNTGQFSDITD